MDRRRAEENNAGDKPNRRPNLILQNLARDACDRTGSCYPATFPVQARDVPVNRLVQAADSVSVPIIFPLVVREHGWRFPRLPSPENFEVMEEHRNFVLSLAGRDARGFRSRFRKKYLIDEDGNLILQLLEKYAQLNTMTDYWLEFSNQNFTEYFKKESAKNVEKARRMTLRYRRSAKGYAKLEQDMVKLNTDSPPRVVTGQREG
ncbi:hypothetical protein SESBI_44862 [Sesbania bispinosa]|nr:hypothetical protein SESBI_44862 [Sesbania bispinosa]